MRDKNKILKKLQNILWSYDVRDLDLKEDKDYIITQVLNYGDFDDLKLLFKLYSEREIKNVIKNPGRGLWFEKVLNFWLKIFNIKLKKTLYQKAIFSLYLR